MGALWAYDGWISITFVGGEVKNPQRFLPRAISVSLLLLIGIYLLLNFAYLKALPLASSSGPKPSRLTPPDRPEGGSAASSSRSR